MPEARVNDVRLHYELDGAGEPLLLIHGSWGDHTGWARAAPGLAAGFRVLRYDRRGHSESERPPGQGTSREDVEDAAALLEHAGLGPAHVVGNSYGACIALRLAATRPDLVRGVAAHEPPFLGLLRGDPAGEAVGREGQARLEPVLRLIEEGRHAEAAERFVEDVALGPGAWAALPEALRRVFTANAPTYLDEMRAPDYLAAAGPEALALDRVRCPVLLSQGDRSPPFFPLLLDRLHALLPRAVRHTYRGAGHIPHITHSDAFVATITAFARKGEAPGP